MTLQISLIDTQEKLAALAPEWDALAGQNPFLGWDWADVWWRTYGESHKQLFSVALRDEAGTLVGLAPWYLGHSLATGNVVRFIGSNEVCGDRLTIIARPDVREQVIETLANWLATDARHAWDLIELTGVEQSDENVQTLAASLADYGHITHTRPDLNAWKIELPDLWEGYLKTLSKARRNRTRRLIKNMVDARRAEQHIVTGLDNFDRGFAVLVDLHQKRRNCIGEPGCFASEQYTAFHKEFSRRMLQQNRLRLGWTEIEGRPAAVEHNFLGTDTLFNYQSGFDPELAAEQPGWLNLSLTLRWCTENGYRTFDMLRGDEAYKASFGAQPTPLVRLRIVGHQPSARLRHAAWQTQSTVKRWAREGLKRAHEWRNAAEKETTESTEPAEANA